MTLLSYSDIMNRARLKKPATGGIQKSNVYSNLNYASLTYTY